MRLIRERPDDGDVLGALERQDPVVLEENHGFFGEAQRELAMRRAVELSPIQMLVGNLRRRIEHSEPHPRGEQADQCRVHCFLGQISVPNRVDIRLVIIVTGDFTEGDAFVVYAANQRNRRGFRLDRAVMVPLEYVVHRTAVGDDVAGKMPRAAQRVLEQELVGAGRLTVHGIVGAHD